MDSPSFRKLKLDIRALLQSAGAYGLTIGEVERDYEDLFQAPLPYAEYGCTSTHELLANMSDVVMIMPAVRDKETTYYAISDPSTRHLEALIDRQRLRPITRLGGKVAADLLPESERETIAAKNAMPSSEPSGNRPLAPPPGFAASGTYGSATGNQGSGEARPIGRRLGYEHLLGIRAASEQRLPSVPPVNENHLRLLAPFGPPVNENRPMATGVGNGQHQAQATPRVVNPPGTRAMREEGTELLRKLNELSLARAAANLPPSNANHQPAPTAAPMHQQMSTAAQQQAPLPSLASIRFPCGAPPAQGQPIPLNTIRFPQGPPMSQGRGSSIVRASIPIPPGGQNIGKPTADFKLAQPSTMQPPASWAQAAAAAIPTMGHPQVTGPPQAQAAASTNELESAAACASTRQRHDSAGSTAASVITTTTAVGYDFPEEAPIILQTQLPVGVKMPHKLWEVIYSILREQNGKWLDIRQFQTEYARKTKRPLSADYLSKHCGIRSYKQLFVDLPTIDVMHTPDDVMYVRLLAPSFNKKNVSMYDVKPRYQSSRPQTHGGVSMPQELAAELENEEKLLVPEPPSDSSMDPHPSSLIPQDVRIQVYQLLWHKYRNGIDISTFGEMFTKRYGASLNTQRTCGMSLERALYYMNDLVEMGKGDDGRAWLRPVPYDRVKSLFVAQKRAAKQRQGLGFTKKPNDADDDFYPPQKK